jgi:hypothetical protein
MSQFLKYALGDHMLQFTGRKTWKAKLYNCNGRLIEIVPVTWTDKYNPSTNTIWLYYHTVAEQVATARRVEHFYAAVARHVPGRHPRKFGAFVAVVLVQPTGRRDPSNNRIQADVLSTLEGSIKRPS